jgi:primosomal protein N''
VSFCCEKLIAEAGDISRTQGKGNVRRWKPLPKRLMKTQQAEKTEVCALVDCKVRELVKRL